MNNCHPSFILVNMNVGISMSRKLGRKDRRTFSMFQLRTLEEAYLKSPYIRCCQFKELPKLLGLKPVEVKVR